MTLEAQVKNPKIIKWSHIKLKASASKGHNQHRKGNLWNRRKYLQIIYLIKGQYPKYTRSFATQKLTMQLRNGLTTEQLSPGTTIIEPEAQNPGAANH